MKGMEKEEVISVLRTWLKKQIDAHGGQRRFGEATKIPAPQFSTALSGDTGVSWGMLAKISESTGPSMDEIMIELSRLFAAAQNDKKVRQAREATADHTSHPLEKVSALPNRYNPQNRPPIQETPTTLGEPKRLVDDHASASTRPHAPHRPQAHRGKPRGEGR